MNMSDIITESQHKCPHCGGPLVEYSDLMEKKDACYYKVKASAKVWPSAYASGRLVQCRKKGADNYGKSKNEGVAEGSNQPTSSKKFYSDKKQWQHDVDDINHSVYDDESEYIGNTGRSTVTINGREWARWSDAQQKGYINMGSMSEQGVAEGSLEELANTSLKVKEPKDFVNTNDRKQVTYKVMKFKSGKDTYLINFTVKGPPAFGKKQNWNAVNVGFGVREPQDDYSFGDEINTDLTARNKNQFLIYSTVINAIRKFITEYNTEIDEIIMQGAGERQEAMYQRFFQSAGKYFPGWHHDGKHSLVRDVPRQTGKKVREQGVAEGSDRIAANKQDRLEALENKLKAKGYTRTKDPSRREYQYRWTRDGAPSYVVNYRFGNNGYAEFWKEQGVTEGRKPFRDLKSWTDHAKSQGLKVSKSSDSADWTHNATDKQGNVRGRFVSTNIPQNSRGFIHQQGVAEGNGAAQQAAIAIAKRKSGKYSKQDGHRLREDDPVAEEWSQKYKSSINCSHPKGFSQKAHCAGKKKHNESIEMEMVCEDCGMCETHGDHSRDNLDEACEQDALARMLELGGVPLMEQAHQQFDMIEEMVEQLAEQHGVAADEIWEDFESVDDHELLETAAWRRSAGKSKKGGLNARGVASYRAEHPGSKLQMAVTTKPSKLKPGSKAAKRRKSFCARMGGVKGPMKKPNGKPTRKALALRKWNC